MVKRKTTVASFATEVRCTVKAGGCPERSSSVQRFFKEEIQSHGWRTAALRRVALCWRRKILQEFDLKFLLQVADHLFAGTINEDKNVAGSSWKISRTSLATKNCDGLSHGCPASPTGLTMMRRCTI
jgi:hypothetical protein